MFIHLRYVFCLCSCFFYLCCFVYFFFFFFSSRRRHTRCLSDWSSDVCSSDLRKLTDSLHKDRYVVSEDVPVDDEAYDLKALSAVTDFLVPMVYDEHYQTGRDRKSVV